MTVTVNTVEEPSTIQEAVNTVLSETLKNGTVGNLNLKPDSVNVMESRTHEGRLSEIFMHIL